MMRQWLQCRIRPSKMPRNPLNKRIEVLLSPEQYLALKEHVQAEYKGSMDATVSAAEISQAIRDILSMWIPSFSEAKPLIGRGKYQRERKKDVAE